MIKKDKKIVPAAVIGFIAAVLVCGIKLFFMHAHRIVPYSFSNNFIYYLFRQSMLPVFVLYGLFFAVSRDSVEYKINYYLPLVLCFYMVYLPYNIVSASSSIIPGFILFVKPVIYLSMIFETSITLRFCLDFFNEKKYPLVAASILLILLYLVLPAIIESLYVTGTSFLLVLIISLLYCALPCFYGVIKAITKAKEILK